LEIFNAEKVKELNARGDHLKAGITEVLFEVGIYPREHAAYLQDVIEVDSFSGDTLLYTGNDQAIPLPKVFISSRGSMLNVRFTGPDAELWHNLYYHHMLEKNIYLSSRGFTPLNLEITDENVEVFIGAVKEFIITHLEQLIKAT